MPIKPPSADTDKLPCGVIQLDQSRQVIYCNHYAAELLAEKPGKLIGQRIDELVTLASRIIIDSYVYPILFEASKAEELQINLRKSTGSAVSVVVNISMDEEKFTLWTLMACENRDSLYEELLSMRDTLHQQTLELQTSNTRIQNEHDDLEVFCRSLSHDFTTPIQQIRYLITYAMEDLQSKDLVVDDELELLERSIQCADVLGILIKGLVEYLSADARVQINERVSLDDIVSSAITLNESDQPLKITVDPLPAVVGNPAQLLIIFKNLIGNAIKYTEGVSVVAISCVDSHTEGRITVVVRDNGIGMAEEYLHKIFEPFSRLHGKSEYSGSGLGLSIVKRLVFNHDGLISVESTLGEGSTFYVELSLHEPVSTAHIP